MLRIREIAEDDEAKRIIMTLYDEGYGIAVSVIDEILGTQITREEREDLIHDGFLKLVIRVEKLRKRTRQEQLAYMAKTMRTVALDEARRRIKQRLLDSLDVIRFPEPESTDLTPEEYCMMKEDTEEKVTRIRAALGRMTERERRLLIEKYQNGRADVEIGIMLGIKTRNVRVYLARARRKLAIYYGEEIDGKQKQIQHRGELPRRRIFQENESEGI